MPVTLALVHARVGPPINGDLYSPPSASAPAVLILHEWWGLNDQIRGFARRIAQEGFHALALDLYGGAVTTDAGEAARLAQAMKTSDAMDQVQAATDWIASQPQCNGKVGVLGFCMGGGQALAAACNVRGLSAAVPFYGLPLLQYADWSRATAPVLGHYARRDTYVGPERVAAVETAMRAAGVDFTFHQYDADHAFMREGDPSAYNAASAALAWERTLGFLREKLG